ncbi:sugar phosphate isomerase/epimerase family protein [Clostridium sp. HMP27]|uniref:sugar phosphate isomerase/epimerase family protein n=1 Tax=Clostridium sp. HMP27 TaxID=1487921 RepID=UPI00052B5FD6|nr:sugar phosphate isomerase/epimerase family protein [Clostridium sp. HMP27]KGK86339.1 hypothetical protein DP68_14120 [Clostridium sp. HMP27]
MEKRLYSVGVWAFGSCSDRFCEAGYHEGRTFKEKVECASKVKGLSGIEIHYNGDFTKANAEETRKIIQDAGLRVSAINCETFGNRIFAKGALTSTDSKIRQSAIDIVKAAGEMTEYFDASLVNLWPGADGFDYSFQIDFVREYELLMDSIRQITEANPKVKYSLEYKLREPRMRSTIGTACKALAVTNEISKENLGVTLDFGHSIAAKESPAEAAAFLSRYNKLFHVHLNDNTRDWDDDLITASYHLWETLEFLYYLKKCNYNGWIGFDMSPWREDQIKAVEHSIEIVEKMFGYVDEIDDEELSEALKDTNALRSHRLLWDKLFK